MAAAQSYNDGGAAAAAAADDERAGAPESQELKEVAEQLRAGVEIKDRRHYLRVFKNCFVGSDAVAYMVSSGMTSCAEDAVALGNALLDAGLLAHVVRDHDFQDKALFYRFTADEDHGTVATTDGKQVSWATFLGSALVEGMSSPDEAALRRPGMPTLAGAEDDHPDLAAAGKLFPLDSHNVSLLDKVHPAKWNDPSPKKYYDLVVIGAGAGGLVSAAGAAGVGAKVALIEEHLMGGDCLNVGCVPSKALIRAARLASELRRAQTDADGLGITLEGTVNVDFPKVMERMRRLRAEIADNDSVERFASKLGVDVFLGTGTFASKGTVEVNGQTLAFSKCVIATGGSPQLPKIPGLHEVYENQPWEAPCILTNENLFNLVSLPKRMGVIGAGAIGVEMAQAFARFGTDVTVFARSGRILPKEDLDIAAIVQERMKGDGVKFELTVKSYTSVQHKDGTVTLNCDMASGEAVAFEFDALLVAAGRRPNVSKLNLEVANVKYTGNKGVEINDRLQTSNDNVFAVGDVCSPYQFTHASDFMARMVVRNALFFGSDKFSSLLIPWCTYTSPEVAHVGAFATDLETKGVAYDVYEKKLEQNDRAILEGHTEGLVRIICKKGSDKILGASIVAEHAGEMLNEITLAMQSGVGLSKMASVIHAYPTEADAIRACGDLYNKTRLTTMVRKLLRGVIALHRPAKC